MPCSHLVLRQFILVDMLEYMRLGEWLRSKRDRGPKSGDRGEERLEKFLIGRLSVPGVKDGG